MTKETSEVVCMFQTARHMSPFQMRLRVYLKDLGNTKSVKDTLGGLPLQLSSVLIDHAMVMVIVSFQNSAMVLIFFLNQV